MDMDVSLPMYQKIAIDMARKIAKGKYKDGEKIYSRTSVATQYDVSPETARRAIAVLADLQIVETVKGSGVTILSQQKARDFIGQYTAVHSVGQIRQEIADNLKQQQKQAQQLEKAVSRLLDKTKRFQADNPLLPVEIPIKKTALHLNKTLSETSFWHHTGATVVAIQRGTELMLSPGPYVKLREGDILLVIGDQDVYERTCSFLYDVV